jgi:hypothetical protein
MMERTPPAALPSEPQWEAARRTRPTLVSILAVLHIISGAGILFILVRYSSRLATLGGPMGASPLFLNLSILFLGALGLASGIGMWRGAEWGWWLAGLYYVYGIYRNANAVFLISSMANELAGEARGPGYYYFKHTARVFTHALVLFYLFRDRVLAYFGLQQLEKARALVRLAAPVAVLIVIQLLALRW